MTKRWQLKKEVPEEYGSTFPELPAVIKQLLFNRNLRDQKSVDEFFNPDYVKDVHDPFLFKNMEGAVQRIFRAIKDDEKIVIYGDYDVDGVTGTTILYTVLKYLGTDNIHTHLPHREKEGYGLNAAAVQEFIDMAANLLITVDCGIANPEEIKLAKEGGLDVIIVDHHQPKSEYPPADYIIHSGLKEETYPFKYLSGGGTAFKLAQAMLVRNLENNEAFEKWLLDLVALSTVADMVTLLGENRTLVKYGLMVLNKTRRPGLESLIRLIGNRQGRISSDDIAWRIAPRLNAAGRMDHANAALELLLTEDEKKAAELANLINRQNTERQRETEKMITEIEAYIGDIHENTKGITASDSRWSVSLLGLAAGRISQKYSLPVFIMSEQEDKVMGSGRGPEGVNLLEILETINEEVALDRFGGHKQACGFTIFPDKLDEFKKAFDKVTKKLLAGTDLSSKIIIETEINLSDVDWKLWNFLVKFEPFGVGNPKPIFLIKNLLVQTVDLVGNGGKHLKLSLKDPKSGTEKQAIAFGYGKEWGESLTVGTKIDIACEIDINEWNGNRELQIKIVDLRFSE